MRAEESDCDRKAEVHLHRQGRIDRRIDPLDEYGEYIESHDKAICCYVPVSSGDQIKLVGSFRGTTQTVAYDVAIDGVLRKVRSYEGKSIARQTKRIDADKFWFLKDEGLIEAEAEIEVVPALEIASHRSDQREIFGTLEVRLFVMRAVGDECSPEDGPTFYNVHEATSPPKTFKDMPQDAKVKFAEDCPFLEKSCIKRNQNKLAKKRPGKQPWAIFGFHLRSIGAIEKHRPDKSYSLDEKIVGRSNVLSLEPVPALEIEPKPQGNSSNGDQSASGSAAASTPTATQTTLVAPDIPSSPATAVSSGEANDSMDKTQEELSATSDTTINDKPPSASNQPTTPDRLRKRRAPIGTKKRMAGPIQRNQSPESAPSIFGPHSGKGNNAGGTMEVSRNAISGGGSNKAAESIDKISTSLVNADSVTNANKSKEAKQDKAVESADSKTTETTTKATTSMINTDDATTLDPLAKKSHLQTRRDGLPNKPTSQPLRQPTQLPSTQDTGNPTLSMKFATWKPTPMPTTTLPLPPKPPQPAHAVILARSQARVPADNPTRAVQPTRPNVVPPTTNTTNTAIPIKPAIPTNTADSIVQPTNNIPLKRPVSLASLREQLEATKKQRADVKTAREQLAVDLAPHHAKMQAMVEKLKKELEEQRKMLEEEERCLKEEKQRKDDIEKYLKSVTANADDGE